MRWCPGCGDYAILKAVTGALADVASGGELSRISLAIQVATANCARVPTLIFDEIDTGIYSLFSQPTANPAAPITATKEVVWIPNLASAASTATTISVVRILVTLLSQQ